eukprot:4161729-Amphidinium_carterae.2
MKECTDCKAYHGKVWRWTGLDVVDDESFMIVTLGCSLHSDVDHWVAQQYMKAIRRWHGGWMNSR